MALINYPEKIWYWKDPYTGGYVANHEHSNGPGSVKYINENSHNEALKELVNELREWRNAYLDKYLSDSTDALIMKYGGKK